MAGTTVAHRFLNKGFAHPRGPQLTGIRIFGRQVQRAVHALVAVTRIIEQRQVPPLQLPVEFANGAPNDRLRRVNQRLDDFKVAMLGQHGRHISNVIDRRAQRREMLLVVKLAVTYE